MPLIATKLELRPMLVSFGQEHWITMWNLDNLGDFVVFLCSVCGPCTCLFKEMMTQMLRVLCTPQCRRTHQRLKTGDK